MPPSTIDRATTQSSRGWQWMMPNVAVGAFILAMIALVWLLQKRDFDQQTAALARDVEWAEQTLRVNMQGDEDFLPRPRARSGRRPYRQRPDSARARRSTSRPIRTCPASPGSMRTRPSATPSRPRPAGAAQAGHSRTASRLRVSSQRAIPAGRCTATRMSARIPARPSSCSRRSAAAPISSAPWWRPTRYRDWCAIWCLNGSRKNTT